MCSLLFAISHFDCGFFCLFVCKLHSLNYYLFIKETFGLFTPGNGPRCLVGVFNSTKGILTQRLGYTDLEVCTHVVNAGNQKGILIGYQPLVATKETVVRRVDEVFGTLDVTSKPPPSSFHTIASTHLVSYPVQGVLNDNGYMFVAVHGTDTVPSSMKDATLDPLSQIVFFEQEMQSGNDESSTNSIWSPGVQKWNVATAKLEWAVDVTTTNDRVTVLSSVAHVAQEDFLLVGGYSKGSATEDKLPSDRWKGFLTKLDPETGAPLGVTKYVMSQDGKNDRIRDICVSGQYAFVVGDTEGIINGIQNGGAFLIKIDVDTLETKWQIQIPGMGVEGMYCAVHEDTSIVYVGGNVPENVEVEIGKGSLGRDIFVTQVDYNIGTVLWTRQFGHDTHITIKGLVADQEGDAILCGNSFNDTAFVNDAFILNMHKENGAHAPEWIKLAAVVDEEKEEKNDDTNDNQGLIIAGSIILPLLFLAGIVLCWCRYHRRGSKEEIPQDHQEEAKPTPVMADAHIL